MRKMKSTNKPELVESFAKEVFEVRRSYEVSTICVACPPRASKSNSGVTTGQV